MSIDPNLLLLFYLSFLILLIFIKIALPHICARALPRICDGTHICANTVPPSTNMWKLPPIGVAMRDVESADSTSLAWTTLIQAARHFAAALRFLKVHLVMASW